MKTAHPHPGEVATVSREWATTIHGDDPKRAMSLCPLLASARRTKAMIPRKARSRWHSLTGTRRSVAIIPKMSRLLSDLRSRI